jgi:hypothetical protein
LVRALEGILFVVSDVAYLMRATLMMAATSAALCGAASYFDVGIVRLWAAPATLNVVRIAILSWRFRPGYWVVVAAASALA